MSAAETESLTTTSRGFPMGCGVVSQPRPTRSRLGVPHLHPLGFVLLSIGTGLYAAGMSSVKAVKLSMKLETGD